VVAEKLQLAAAKSRKVKDLWHGLVRNYAHDLGLVNGERNYTPFVLLGRSRIGSNLLRSYLNMHSQIVAFGEIFRHTGVIGWDFSLYPQTKAMRQLITTDPVRFTETQVYGRFPNHIRAVGFKLFYYHAHDASGEAVWRYLHDHKEIKIIHLTRSNMLRTFISRENAKTSNVWKRNGSQPVDEARRPIHLNYAECLQEFVNTRAWEEKYDAYFADHDKLNITYEALVAQAQAELERLQEFLGVDYEVVHTETRKQSNRRLVEAIANYQEVKAQFAGTPWSDFFEE
jgi:LPS sulfotransferase NodH